MQDRTLPGEPLLEKIYWHIAQLVERLTVNQDVPGSSPGLPARRKKIH